MTAPADDLRRVAAELLDALETAGATLVLAESCTGGRAAAALVSVPGASIRFAGSLVVYQAASKSAWLGVPAEMIDRHTAESGAVAEALATAALDRTPHATVAGAIVGHLGPDAPAGQDGSVRIAVVPRGGRVVARECRLRETSREDRQTAAAALLLSCVGEAIAGG